MSSPSTVALRITSNLYSFSDHTDNFIRSPVSIEIHKHPTRNHRHARSLLWAPQCCLFTLLPPSTVAYLRKRNVVLSHCYNSANVIEPREPHTCNNMITAYRTKKTEHHKCEHKDKDKYIIKCIMNTHTNTWFTVLELVLHYSLLALHLSCNLRNVSTV
jgi:hypothetical protein